MEENKMDKRPYDEIAYNVFMPIFPMIADEALSVHGKRSGKCLDIGCGGGLFGYMIALISDMELTFLDVNEAAMETCLKRGRDWGLEERCSYCLGDVHDMSLLESESYDLIVSRGSMPFWGSGAALIQAFKEISRVLAPGGTAIIGGSLGTPKMKKAITDIMHRDNPNWQPPSSKMGDCVSNYNEKSRFLKDVGIDNEPLVNDKGHWIVIKK